jgi:hypothetical protein
VFLLDKFFQTKTLLHSKQNISITFNNNPASIADDRFALVFENSITSTNANFVHPEPKPVFFAYPNPVLNQLTLEYANTNANSLHLSLVDISGRAVVVQQLETIQSTGKATINTNTLANGVYILRIQHENGTVLHTQKVIK